MTPTEALQATIKDIKDNLQMSYVMSVHGHSPALAENGKLHYHSPFRHDEHPSFDVFKLRIGGSTEPEERFGDYGDPNINQGDVIDLVKRFEPGADHLSRARELLHDQLTVGWEGPVVKESTMKALDLDDVSRLMNEGRVLDEFSSLNWERLTRSHPGLVGMAPPPDRMFLHPTTDTIMFTLFDEEGKVVGLRQRFDNGKKLALKGSRNVLMRMTAPDPSLPVFLCEGETDTWAAYGALKDYEVMGIPGANTSPEKAGAHSLAGRVVYLAFDPDDAGVAARDVWSKYLTEKGCTVRTIILPEGKDLAAMHPQTIRSLPSKARHQPSLPPAFIRQGPEFHQVRKDSSEPVSNFSFTPTKILEFKDGTRSYLGTLLPQGKEVILPSSALRNRHTLMAWGEPMQARWYGSDTLVQKLAATLDHEAAFLPSGLVNDQVGLYEGTFAWPSGYIGDEPVSFVPTVSEVKLGDKQIFLKEEQTNLVNVFRALYESQHPAVTGPMLAWLAVAPLRTLFNEFPALNIEGGSGSGKSTLTSEFLRVFSSSAMNITLTSTTPHAVASMIDSSCGFPIWFDEYRPGAREGARQTLDQLLRDAYTMQESAKGGQDSKNLSKLGYIRTAAPIIVSGEDSFSEVSHQDRMVLVRLSANEQGDLGRLKLYNTAGFGHAYLHALAHRVLPSAPGEHTPPYSRYLPSIPKSNDNVTTRQQMNLRVLRMGWQILEEMLDTGLPNLDLSRVIAAYSEASKSSPLMDLIQICYDNDTFNPTAWTDSDYLYVHTGNLLSEHTRNHRSIVLPGSNSTALRRLLEDQYGAESCRSFAHGKQIRCLRVPINRVDWLNDNEQVAAEHGDNSSSK